MRTPESWEKEALDKYLVANGFWFCCPATYGYGKSGNPDRIAVKNGKFYGLEVKREGKGPTVLQQRRIDEIRRAGGYAWAGTADMLIRQIEKTL